MITRRFAIVIALIGLACVACKPAQLAQIRLVEPAELGPDIVMHQNVAIRIGPNELLAQAVLVKRGNNLDIALLAPTGMRIGSINQQGQHVKTDLTFDGKSDMHLFLLREIRWGLFFDCPNSASKCMDDNADVRVVRDTSGRATNLEFHWNGQVTTVVRGAFWESNGQRFPKRLTISNLAMDYELEIMVNSVN